MLIFVNHFEIWKKQTNQRKETKVLRYWCRIMICNDDDDDDLDDRTVRQILIIDKTLENIKWNKGK